MSASTITANRTKIRTGGVKNGHGKDFDAFTHELKTQFQRMNQK